MYKNSIFLKKNNRTLIDNYCGLKIPNDIRDVPSTRLD